MTKDLQKNLKEFLRESNYIENERSKKAEEDAYKAWRFLENFDELTLPRILETHKILMERINPFIAGKLRNVRVRVGYHFPPPPDKVERLMELWVECLGPASTEEDIKRAPVEFEGIHPFENSNGRTGRILMNWQRVKNGFPIEVIYEKEKDKYYDWFEGETQFAGKVWAKSV